MATKRIVRDLSIADRLNPNAEGKSICYDRLTLDYALFLDRNYLGHASTYGEAEVKINQVYYDQLADEAVLSADLAADALLPFEPTVAEMLEHEACIGAAAVVSFPTIPATPAIRIEPNICQDEIDRKNYGTQTGTNYYADDVEVHFPNAPTNNPGNEPIVFIETIADVPLETLFRLYPALTALVTSTEVQAAWSHWQEQVAERRQRKAA